MLAAFSEDRLLFLRERPPLLAFQLGDRVVGFAFPLVTEAFVKHERKDVVFVVLAGRFAAEDVGGAPEMRLKLLESEFHICRDCFLFHQMLDVGECDHQRHRLRRRRIETKRLIEGFGLFGNRVNDDATNADRVGRMSHA